MRDHVACLWVAFTAFVVGTATAEERAYRPPRLSDGRPDLQGMWTNTNLTPLVRPRGIDSLVITPEQVSVLMQRVDSFEEDRKSPTEPTEYFDRRSFEPIRGQVRSSIIVDPADGKLPGNDLFKTAFAQFQASIMNSADGPEQRPASERCLPTTTAQPPMLPWPSNSLWQWVQTRDVILIYAEALHDARVIRIDSRHAPAAVTSWLGDSIGWWEGDSLVVETKHFPPTDHGRLSPYHAYLLSHEATVTERFKRTSANELQYDFTVADPVYYTQPWKGEAHFTRTTDRSYEYACHEGNYTLLSVLQAARNREHALQETSGASSNPTTSVTSPPK